MTDDGRGRRGLARLGPAAALLGAGALLTGTAEANPTHMSPAQAVLQIDDLAGEVVLRMQGNAVFLSQDGQDLGCLELTDSAASQTLREWLAQNPRDEAGTKPVSAPLVVADGGGGYAWPRPISSAVAKARSSVSKPRSASRDQGVKE